VATGLTKRYGDVTAVKDLSFEVRAWTAVFLLAAALVDGPRDVA
jgi:ABC-type multidrug transport system ATPase subunit